jgi:hypothetical protein
MSQATKRVHVCNTVLRSHLQTSWHTCGSGGGGGDCGVYVARGQCPCLIMSQLHAKVARILRECGVPWTAARTRYARLYCALRHLEGRTCARRRDVRVVVAVMMRDWCNHRSGHPYEPSRRMLDGLALLELDVYTNAMASPFFPIPILSLPYRLSLLCFYLPTFHHTNAGVIGDCDGTRIQSI